MQRVLALACAWALFAACGEESRSGFRLEDPSRDRTGTIPQYGTTQGIRIDPFRYGTVPMTTSSTGIDVDPFRYSTVPQDVSPDRFGTLR